MRKNRLIAIVILGIAVIGIAWSVQCHFLALRRQQPRVVSPPVTNTPVPPPPNTSPPPENVAQKQEEAALRAAVAAHPMSHANRWQLLNFLVDNGKPAEAAKQADALVRLGIHDPRETLALANACLALKQYPQADALCRKLIQSGHSQADAWQMLATALYLENRYFAAMQAAQEAVKLAPASAGSHLALAQAALKYALQFGNAGTHHAALDLAHTEFQKLTQEFPGNAVLSLRLGQTDIARSRWEDAVGPLTQAVTLDPTAEGYYGLAFAEKNASNLQAANATMEAALTHFPADPALHDLNGQIEQESPDPNVASQALGDFQAAVRTDPSNGKYLQHEGSALLRMNKLPEAQAAFIAAAKADPNDSFPPQQLAVIYTREGNIPRANAAAKIAAALVFNQQQLNQIQGLIAGRPQSVPLHLILADRYRQLGQLGAARDEYLLVSELDPGNVRARQGLAALDAGHAR